jgi:catechol 2,3-dioxygenase-like lactoylglutathione lyase family enzyme
MMVTESGPWGVRLAVPDPAAAARWLEENLFFSSRQTGSGLSAVNGDCLIELVTGESTVLPPPAQGQYYAGLAHIALRTRDIEAAIIWCQSRRLDLQLEQGHCFYNPKVYGDGEYFFNIISPFGVIFEVSQRLAEASPCQDPVICGLDHLGLPSADFAATAEAFSQLGFVADFPPVENWNAAEGRIRCSMFSQTSPQGQRITLEIYQFLDRQAVPIPESYGIRGLLMGKSRQSAADVVVYPANG